MPHSVYLQRGWRQAEQEIGHGSGGGLLPAYGSGGAARPGPSAAQRCPELPGLRKAPAHTHARTHACTHNDGGTEGGGGHMRACTLTP